MTIEEKRSRVLISFFSRVAMGPINMDDCISPKPAKRSYTLLEKDILSEDGMSYLIKNINYLSKEEYVDCIKLITELFPGDDNYSKCLRNNVGIFIFEELEINNGTRFFTPYIRDIIYDSTAMQELFIELGLLEREEDGKCKRTKKRSY